MTETNKPSKTTMGPLIDLREKPSHEDTTKDDIETGDVVYTRDAPSDGGITKTRQLEGFTYVRYNPHGWFKITKRVGDREIPGNYTTEHDIMHAILNR